jgi:hypothetical protein
MAGYANLMIPNTWNYSMLSIAIDLWHCRSWFLPTELCHSAKSELFLTYGICNVMCSSTHHQIPLLYKSQHIGSQVLSLSCYIIAAVLYIHSFNAGPPLWSSGQSSWLQIRRPGFDSRHYQKQKVVGLEGGPLSLVSTTEELLHRKVAAPV